MLCKSIHDNPYSKFAEFCYGDCKSSLEFPFYFLMMGTLIAYKVVQLHGWDFSTVAFLIKDFKQRAVYRVRYLNLIFHLNIFQIKIIFIKRRIYWEFILFESFNLNNF